MDQGFDHKHVQVVLLANELSLNLLASEGVPDEAELEGEPVRVLRVLQLRLLIVAQLDHLLKSVSQKEVVGRRVRHF